jgi:hypothetical protein
MNYEYLTIQPAEDSRHKYVASFYNIHSGVIKHVKFGAAGYKDYPTYVLQSGKEIADIHKASYINRHQAREDWSNPISKGALSKYILWNKPSLKASLKDYLKTFFND